MIKSLQNLSIKANPLQILLIFICVLLSYLSALDGGDFDVYLEAAQKLYHGSNPYLPPYAKDGMGYAYSPFFIMLLIPFSGNYFITEFFWCLLSCWMLYRSFYLSTRYFESNQLDQSEYKKMSWILLCLSFQFANNNIGMVQITIFLLWVILEAIRLIRNQHQILGGFLIGAIINIKIMPIVMLGYLLFRGYFMAFSMAVFTAIALLYSPTLFWGFDYNLVLLSDWWDIINPTNEEHQLEAGIGTHSMVAFLPVYLTETVGGIPYARNLLDLEQHTAIIITHIANLFLVALSLLYFRSLPFVKEKDDLKSFWEIAYFLLLIPLVMPHQQKYGFILVMPMVAYIVYFLIKTRASFHSTTYKWVFGIFVVSMLVFSPLHGSDILGKFAFKWSQHYRLITIVTLTLIPISLYCSPPRLIKMTRKI